MKPVLILCMAAFCAVVSAQTVTQANGLSAENGTLKTSGSARTLFADDFTTAKDGSWKINNYQNRLKIERKKHNGKSAIVVTNGIGKAMDTAFDLIVLPLEVENLKQYSITFSASASFYTEGLAGRKLSSQNRIVFLDAAQKVIKAEKFRFSSSKKGYKENVISGTAPAGTKYVSIAFGADTPDVRPGNFVAIADLKIRVVDTLPAWDANSGAKVVLSDDFSKESGAWEPAKNYKNVLKIERKNHAGKPALVIANESDKAVDTAFSVATKKIDLNGAAQYKVSFDLYANYWTADYGKAKRGSRSCIVFYDITGKMIASHPVIYHGSTKTYKTYTVSGKVPANAASFALLFGGDSPDVRPGKFIAITNVKIQLAAAGTKGSFVSGIFPVKERKISWKSSGKNASVRFQVATAEDQKGAPASFSPFSGPDGTAETCYSVNGAELKLPANAKWIRYKAELIAGNEPATLESVRIAGNTDCGWKTVLDTAPPRFRLLSPSPVADGKKPVRIGLEDDSMIDRTTVQLELDGKPFSGKTMIQNHSIELLPVTPFSSGVHELKIAAKDLNGNKGEMFLYFRIGKAAEKGVVTLRHDGMTLLDGKPFFPIGIYNVQKLPINGNDYDNAFSALKAAGVNFVQTYSVRRDANYREFMKSVQKHGLKVWIAGEGSSNDADLPRIARSLTGDLENPALLAWYIGDDTDAHNTVLQLEERTALVKALAPHLITVQADSLDVAKGSRYKAFAHSTLAFMPEIYAIKKGDKANGASCVAEVMRDVDQCFKDIRERKLSPRSIWPIIQYFKGWHTYKRFPTPLELRAMSFAALIRGAHGIIYYTYNSRGSNQGVSANETIWKNFSAVTKEIASYAPVLQTVTPAEQIRPEIVNGPQKNAFGGDSVAALTKQYNGKTYVFCVNSTLETVTVRLKIPGDPAKIVRLSPAGKPIVKKGYVEETFAPYDVRIYMAETERRR